MKKGLIFDIKRYAIHDGSGIRTTVFFKGCPLNCFWCHNPEGISSGKELMYKETKCISCMDCVNVCKVKALYKKSKTIYVDRKKCTICGDCTEICPSGAMELIGREIDTKELFQEICKDMIFYDESDGGITFSGGEPMLQIDFLDSILSMCRNAGINTVLDTSGYAEKKDFKKIMEKVNTFLYDIKCIENSKHKKMTGVSNTIILENLKMLSENNANIIIRYPLIPGFNDSEKDIDELKSLLNYYENINQINILPFHKIGTAKYNGLNKPFEIIEKIDEPPNRLIKRVKNILVNEGFIVKTGG